MIYPPYPNLVHWDRMSMTRNCFHPFTVIKDSLDVATQVNDDLKRVAFWCSQNSLLINPTKTKVLVVGTCYSEYPPILNLFYSGKNWLPSRLPKTLDYLWTLP